jgi:hypothetical protein
MISLILQAADNDGLSNNETAIAIVGTIAIFTAVIIVSSIVAWQLLGAWRTRMAVGREKAYQELADEMAKSQRRTETGVQRVLDELVDIRNRTAEIERMLREVG